MTRFKFKALNMWSVFTTCFTALGYAVAQLVQALRYKPEGRGLISGGFIAIFKLLEPSGLNVFLRSTRRIGETSTRDISWG
jgi:hypothetical protein